ncbi:MAG: cytochrome c3 family protein [Acidobacteriota bacterium]|nr:MAG: cytochrome c3 family protein [Acidobacteriota bacterium]
MMRKTFLILVATAAMVAGFWALAGDAAAPKEVLTFEAKLGTVTFNHKDHADKIGDCAACHHTTKAGETPQSCGSCHDAKQVVENAPKLKDAVHSTCWDCHTSKLEAGEKSGPIKKDCKACHVKG